MPLAAGDKIAIWYGAAKRDEEVLPAPQRFDVGRTPNEHMALAGPVECLQ